MRDVAPFESLVNACDDAVWDAPAVFRYLDQAPPVGVGQHVVAPSAEAEFGQLECIELSPFEEFAREPDGAHDFFDFDDHLCVWREQVPCTTQSSRPVLAQVSLEEKLREHPHVKMRMTEKVPTWRPFKGSVEDGSSLAVVSLAPMPVEQQCEVAPSSKQRLDAHGSDERVSLQVAEFSRHLCKRFEPSVRHRQRDEPFAPAASALQRSKEPSATSKLELGRSRKRKTRPALLRSDRAAMRAESPGVAIRLEWVRHSA